eukprot:CAMPEP_0198152686 /NCGR_PEP_ID=MMETSP1443-20131203/60818_1 /TAXON_ID=186043 /ORGANISM="Entomoneis sp., Strain CCMP2396" /LENGTH=45 /DNA_ID= /DNA_START= /DNA_END= /DNA_ORIENTATION=
MADEDLQEAQMSNLFGEEDDAIFDDEDDDEDDVRTGDISVKVVRK